MPMTAVELLESELKRLHSMLDAEIRDITDEQLHAVPGGDSKANTLAWALFHCVRTEDNIVRFVLQDRRPTVWTEGGYAERLGLPPVAQGTGMSTADAHALRIKDVALFREYMQKVWASTDDLLASADPASWDRMVSVKFIGDLPALRVLAMIVVGHGFMHVGQMELTRTLVGAKPVSSV
jgi:hypothetical protein